MRRGAKTWAALVALLLAFGLVACGDDEEPGPTTTEAGAGQAGGGGADRPAGDGQANADADSGEKAGNFEPRRHDDSGGGSEQFRLKGGDNSVQEFGREADETEFEQAAAALHGFLDARAAGQWAAACSYLADDIVASLEELAARSKQGGSTDCPAVLGGLVHPAAGRTLRKEAERADVGSVRVEGESGFVIYRGTEGDILAMSMRRDGGEWKVASLASAPLN